MSKKTTKKKTASKKTIKTDTQKPGEVKPDKERQNITPYPTAGKTVTDFEKTLDQQLSAGTDTGKRRRGRPRKETQQSAPSDKPDAPIEIIEAAVKMPFDFWAIGQSTKELELTEQETKQLAAPVKILLDYYLPYIPEIGYAWAGFVATVYMITKPRLEIIQQKKKTKQSSSSEIPAPAHSSDSKKPAPVVNDQFPTKDDLGTQKL